MANIRPEDISRLPVEQLALSLLEHSQANPALIARGHAVARPGTKEPRQTSTIELGPLPSLALLSDPTVDIRQYLEDLASIAAVAARQAEDSVLEARAVARKANRGMVAVATFGALGLLIGGAGFAEHRNASARLHEVSTEVRYLQDLQRTTSDQLKEVKSGTEQLNTRLQEATAAPAAAYVPAAPARPAPPEANVEATTGWPYTSTPTTQWPAPRPYAHRVVMQTQRPVAPAFLVAINRGLHSLFH